MRVACYWAGAQRFDDGSPRRARHLAAMATAAERKALGFLAAVALAGGAVRVVGVERFAPASASGARVPTGDLGERALAAQRAAVDSARAAGPRTRSSRGRTRGRAGGGGATEAAASRPRTDGAAARSRAGDPPAPFDINAADAVQIERLPRVGPALARRIVDWREKHGPFGGPDDLRHVRGIGPATVRLITPLVTFSGRHSPMLSEGPPGPSSHPDGD